MPHYPKSSFRPTGDSYRPSNQSGDNGQSQRSHRPDLPNQDTQYNGYNNRTNRVPYNNGPGGNPRVNGPRNGTNNYRGQSQGTSYSPQGHPSSYQNSYNGPNGYRKNKGNANYGEGNYPSNHQSNYPSNHQSNYQSNHQSNYQSNHQSNYQSNHQSNYQSNHQSNYQSNHQANYQANHHSNYQSNYQPNHQSNYQPNYQPNYSSNYQSNHNQFSNYGNNKYQKKPHTANHSVYSQAHTENQVWMGDLDPHWTETEINQIWTQLGEVPVNIKLLKDKMGKPSCCFVKFASSTSAANALKRNKTLIPGTSKLFKLNLPSGGSQVNESNQGGSINHASKNSADYSIFVGDLSMDVSEAILFEKFNSVYPGSVKQAKVMTDPNSGASKGFGFVRFVSAEIQQRALKEMNGAILNQRQIRVGQANGANQEVNTKKSGDSANTSVNLAQYQPALTPFTDPNNSVICIKHINYGITRDDLIAHFLAFGHIVYCKVNYHEGVAHIKFLLRGAAERAILYMHGIPINGNRVVLRWGREESVHGQKTRFQPVGKNSKYVSAEKLPPVYGFLPRNVVFEDLTAEEAKDLNFLDRDMSVDTLNQFEQDQIEARNAILNTSF